MAIAPLPDLDTLDAAALKDMVIRQHAQLSSHDAEVERLRLIIVRLRRLQYGRKSEKIQREIEQLELQLEDLEAGNAERQQQAEKTPAPAVATVLAAATRQPARPLPDHLPRQVEIHQPEEKDCPACGGGLSKLGLVHLLPNCSRANRNGLLRNVSCLATLRCEIVLNRDIVHMPCPNQQRIGCVRCSLIAVAASFNDQP